MPDPAPAAPRAQIVVVGDLLVDVVAAHDGPLRVGSDTAAVIRTVGGGSGANAAVWLAVAGAPVALVAAVGDDPLGEAVRAELAAVGIDHLGPVVAGGRTGTCVVLVDPSGERTMLPDRAANDELTAAAVEAALAGLPGGAWTHLSGYTLLHAGSRPAGEWIARRALGAASGLSVDASSAGPLRDIGAATFLALVAGADLLFANTEERDALGGEAAILGAVGAVVTKRGAAGAEWTDGRRRVAVPAAPGPVVDTTGAGDAFAAGFLDAWVADPDPEAALAAGARVAAEAVAVAGARPPGPARG